MTTEPVFVYDCDVSLLGPRLAGRFKPLSRDHALERWLERFAARPHGRILTALGDALARMASAYDVHGWLGLYEMHLLSTAQLAELLGAGPFARWLDVGAGAGYVTEHARALCASIVCTETSRTLAQRLRKRGFSVHPHDLGSVPLEERFEVVSCFNVLDRTTHPVRLLDAMLEQLEEDGRLVLSMPLPVAAHVHVAGGTRSQEEPLPSVARSWEAAAREITEALLAPRGLEIERLARVPYVSRGDAHHPLYVLDAAVWVCREAQGD